MTFLLNYLEILPNTPCTVLDAEIPIAEYCPLDLSSSNAELHELNIRDAEDCQKYITTILTRQNAKVAFGGYLEKRSLYEDKSNFGTNQRRRDIHLGIDFWAEAGTRVVAPLPGKVHSFQNNTTFGDYGPTLILEHTFGAHTFHTLYGHLSLESLDTKVIGMIVGKGDVIGRLGTPDINVGYAPHLHFQIIGDMEGNHGDYPGVCSKDSLAFYSRNCPDPNLLLRIS